MSSQNELGGGGEGNVQSGFVWEGLAMTRPDAAPVTHDPVEPILHRRLVKAIGLSVARNVSTERFLMSESCASPPGRANMGCTARVLARRSEKDCMMSRVVKVVRLKKLLDLAAGKEGDCRKPVPFYNLHLCCGKREQ